MSNSKPPLDRLAFALTLSGVLIGILVAMAGRYYGHDYTMHGFGIFLGFSVTAIVLGIISWSSPLGKAAAITSSVLVFGSFALIF